MTDTLDTRGAAELLHVSESTVQALARAGEIPATQLGGHWLFVRQDLIDTLRARAAEEQQPLPIGDYSTRPAKIGQIRHVTVSHKKHQS